MDLFSVHLVHIYLPKLIVLLLHEELVLESGQLVLFDT